MNFHELSQKEILRLDPYKDETGASRPVMEMMEINELQNLARTRLLQTSSVQAATMEVTPERHLQWGIEGSHADQQELQRTILDRARTHESALHERFGPPLTESLSIFKDPTLTANAAIDFERSFESKNSIVTKIYTAKHARFAVPNRPVTNRTVLHEMGHVWLEGAIPSAECLSEAAADHIEHALRPAGIDGLSVRQGYSAGLHPPIVVKGEDGWWIGELAFTEGMGKLDAAYYQHMLRVCHNDPTEWERVLQYSKKLADQRKAGTAQHERITFPRMADWLEEIDAQFPGFRERFEQSPLAKPMPLGERSMWFKHRKWGGLLAVQSVRENPNFLVEGEPVLDSYRMICSMPHFAAYLYFNTVEGAAARLESDEPIEISPDLIPSAYAQLIGAAPGTKVMPPLGTEVIVGLKDGTGVARLVWNQEAENLSRTPGNW